MQHLRDQFPLLKQKVYGTPLIYLDNAATTQKPQCVLDRLMRFYTQENANVHRGVHYLAEVATLAYEDARKTVAQFINAPDPATCIFVRGTTEAINVVAHGFQQALLAPEDEVIVSYMEHHANLVPWQVACRQSGATLKAIPLTEQGDLDLAAYLRLLGAKTKILALSHVSNTLGTINDLKPFIEAAHAVGAAVLIDGAQAIPHFNIDVQALDCDFYVCSGHKTYGPTGIGLLYGKASWLERLPPYQLGGEMILEVSITESTYNELPHRLEAGTPPIAQALGFAEALRFLRSLNREAIEQHEQELLHYAKAQLSQLPTVHFLGSPKRQVAVLPFMVDGVHPHDVSTALDRQGIAIRSGRHCTHPLLDFYGLHSTCRVSFALYNTMAEIDHLASALEKTIHFFERS